MKRPLLLPAADAELAGGLEAWDAEGGAPAAAHAGPAAAGEHVLLALLGSALVGEWRNLPTPLQRAVYERAVRGGASSGGATLKRQLARFLHDRQQRPGPSHPAGWRAPRSAERDPPGMRR